MASKKKSAKSKGNDKVTNDVTNNSTEEVVDPEVEEVVDPEVEEVVEADKVKVKVKVTLITSHPLCSPCGTVCRPGVEETMDDSSWVSAQEAAGILNVER